MLKNLLIFQVFLNDAPEPWQIGFQDSAAPGFTGIVELHNTVFFYLILICVGVFWMLGSIMYFYNSKKSPIAHKYLNHGSNVPYTKNFKFTNTSLTETFKSDFNIKNSLNSSIRAITFYTSASLLKRCNKNFLIPQRDFNVLSSSQKDPKYNFISTWENKISFSKEENNLNNKKIEINNIKFYENAESMKNQILLDNKQKSGIYRWTNKITGDMYIGQSSNLYFRFTRYYSKAYLENRKNLIISRAINKYGYSNFSLEILEYCEIPLLFEREQYYLDILNPAYNILKIAGSSKGFKQSLETKLKISNALRGKYTGINSPIYGKSHTSERKKLLSLSTSGEKNHFFGKNHSLKSKNLMRLSAIGRKKSEEVKLTISKKLGTPINVFEIQENGEDKLIGKFTSYRKVASFLNISKTTVIAYTESRKVFKGKYKFILQSLDSE